MTIEQLVLWLMGGMMALLTGFSLAFYRRVSDAVQRLSESDATQSEAIRGMRENCQNRLLVSREEAASFERAIGKLEAVISENAKIRNENRERLIRIETKINGDYKPKELS